MTAPAVLSINCGSSSLKFAIYEEGSERRAAEGAVERIGGAGGRAFVRHGAARAEREAACPDHAAALTLAFELLSTIEAPRAGIAGHRIVHGGPNHVQPALVDAALLASLRSLVPLAPLHLPSSLAAIEAIFARDPGMLQVACFDTAFHAGLPEIARRLPLPEPYREVRRYGFHGLSYEYVMSVLGPAAPARIVIAHLGNGASLVAIKDGRPVDTTMGLTPAGGILMGTRTGDLDPGAMIYLARERGLGPDALEQLIERESGLLAIGGTPDMEALIARSAAEPRARLAVDMFGYAVRKAIGAFAAALGGLELLVFTGGIGERAPVIRTEACRGLECFGVVLDADRNARSEGIASAPSSRVLVRVVKTDEDLMIARHARAAVEHNDVSPPEAARNRRR